MRRYHRNGGPIQSLAETLGMSGVPRETGRHALRLVGLIVVVGVAVGTWAGVKAAARIEPTILVQTLANPDETAAPGLTATSPILTSAAIPEVTPEAISQPILIPDLRPGVSEPAARLVSVRFEEEFPEAFNPNQSVVVEVVTAPAAGPTSVPVDASALSTPALSPQALPTYVSPVMTRARIAIIIDDLGLHEGRARQIADLPAVLTLSWLPYAEHIRDQTQYGFERGHQIFAHVPMQPGGDEDPGPNALMTWHGKTEIKSLLDVQLAEFAGLTGINNHMGSRFTQNAMSMSWLMAEVKARDLLFVDSLTSPKSKGAGVAKSWGLPFLKRDFFIDHDAKGNAALVERRLAELEALALERGEVIAIGHPYEVTIAGLEIWIPAARERGIEFITVSRLTGAQPHLDAMQVAQQDN